MAYSPEITKAFFNQELRAWSEELLSRLDSRIQDLDAVDKGFLRKSLSYQLFQSSEFSGVFSLSFAEWGRFVDMGAGKGYLENKELSVAMLKELGRKKRRPKKWYSKTAYGQIDNLISRLSLGLSETAIHQIKTGLKS